jgi:hypothetical protein
MALEGGNAKKFDVFTLVTLLLVLALIVGGQVLTFSALESKIEELESRLDVPTAVIDSKLEHMREEIRMIRHALPGHPGPATPATAAPDAPASAAPGK